MEKAGRAGHRCRMVCRTRGERYPRSADQAKISKGTVELKKGETADIRLVAPAPGTYKLHCSHFLHTSFGMTGEIVVS